jgi:hypothetical protein
VGWQGFMEHVQFGPLHPLAIRGLDISHKLADEAHLLMDHGVPASGRVLVYRDVDDLEGIVDAGLGLDFKEFMCHGRPPSYFWECNVR